MPKQRTPRPAQRRKMRRFALLALLAGLCAAAASGSAAETRESSIDIVLLVDKSLSMRDAIGAATRYLAGEIVGPLVMPGDRLVIEVFYGKTDRLFAGTIRAEEDKARAIASLRALVGDGRFTDIGGALDRAAVDLEELGEPTRPKYVLLVTDERQETPWGTKYYAADYKLKHPSLEYVKKLDLGSFRAITVGLGVGAKVDAAAPGVMRLLEEMPERSSADFPELPAGSDGSLSGAAAADAWIAAAGPGTGTEGEAARKDASGGTGGAAKERNGETSPFGTLLIVFLGVAVLAAALVAALKLAKKRRPGEEPNDH